MKLLIATLSLVALLGGAAVAAPGQVSVSVHASSGSVMTTTRSSSSTIYSQPPTTTAGNSNSVRVPAINTAPAAWNQTYTRQGQYNPQLDPSRAYQQTGSSTYSPYGAYGSGYYGGFGYGNYGSYSSGGGVSPDVVNQSPPGYSDPAPLQSAPYAPGPAADVSPQTPLNTRQVQYIGRLVAASPDTLTLRTRSGDVTLYGGRTPVAFSQGDLVVAWALPSGRWTSLSRVAAPARTTE